MKLLLFYCCFLLMLSCDSNKNKLIKPSFLVGKWVRINDTKHGITYEYWNKSLEGLGYTLKEKDTIFKETLSIVTLNDSLYLKVEGVNHKPTLFKFTQQTDTSFVCENPTNKFPKKITYYLQKNQLKAIVATDEFKIDFVFNKK